MACQTPCNISACPPSMRHLRPSSFCSCVGGQWNILVGRAAGRGSKQSSSVRHLVPRRLLTTGYGIVTLCRTVYLSPSHMLFSLGRERERFLAVVSSLPVVKHWQFSQLYQSAPWPASCLNARTWWYLTFLRATPQLPYARRPNFMGNGVWTLMEWKDKTLNLGLVPILWEEGKKNLSSWEEIEAAPTLSLLVKVVKWFLPKYRKSEILVYKFSSKCPNLGTACLPLLYLFYSADC